MARAALRGRLTWLRAGVTAVQPEGSRTVRLVLDVPDWPGHRAGQHVDVRLTAPDGYTAQRSYSIASAPGEPGVELVVQAVDGGEVSPYLSGGLRAGDFLELRGPIGGYFVWSPELGGPVQLVAGGSGAVPLLAMLRHHRLSGSDAPMRLLYAARSQDDLVDAPLLADPGPHVEVTVVLSRSAPPGWTGPTGRIDDALLRAHALPVESRPQLFVCGPTRFVESMTTALVAQGHSPSAIKAERFGSSGGTS